MKKVTKLIGLDIGETKTGVIIITGAGIRCGLNVDNESVFGFIVDERVAADRFHLVIEDVKPYNMRITDNLVQTIKFLGQLEWRLAAAAIPFTLIPRYEVKQWVFNHYKAMAVPEIQKKIDYLNKRRQAKGETLMRRQTPSMVYVDDRIVQKAMRLHWKIPKPRVGQPAMYGLKDHAWQALGLASFFLVSNPSVSNHLGPT